MQYLSLSELQRGSVNGKLIKFNMMGFEPQDADFLAKLGYGAHVLDSYCFPSISPSPDDTMRSSTKR